MSEPPLLRVQGLSIGYTAGRDKRPTRVVRDVSFSIGQGEIVGLVGESGSGKTQTARAILRMTTRPLRPLGGQVLLDGSDLLALPERSLARVRGSSVAMIFQDPRSSLNPLMRVGDQLARVYALHQRITGRAAWREALDMLQRVGIAGPERVARSYPHQLSGGMCQRVMIGLALGIRPRLLIADEPTTGLDVTIQAQILDLIKQTRHETGASVLLITHDMGVVAETCQRVMVMFDGRIVEIAPVQELFRRPVHPYTLRLLRATPGVPVLASGGADGAAGEAMWHVALDDVAVEDPSVGLREVAPDHLVLCRAAKTGVGEAAVS